MIDSGGRAARSLVRQAPTILSVQSAGAMRRLGCPPMEAMARLSEHLLEELEAGRRDELIAVLVRANHLIRRGKPAQLDVTIVGLLESLHAGVSHRAPAMERSLVAAMPADVLAAWDAVRSSFVDIASWLEEADVEPAVSDAEIEGLTDPEIQRYFRSNYWRSPAGVYVGTADVLAFRLGIPPQRPEVG